MSPRFCGLNRFVLILSAAEKELVILGEVLGPGMKTAIRGAVLTFKGNPYLEPAEDCVVYDEDGVVLFSGGIIEKVGPANDVLPTLDSSLTVEHYKDCLIVPGFIDCHVHYPQTEIIGAYGTQLIEWLTKYTFVAEQRFADENHAQIAADLFLRELLAAGTTTASVFCTVDPVSVDAFFEASKKYGMRNIAGKVLMDRNAPPALLDTPQTAYDQSKQLIEKWHGKNRCLYSVTPRFAPTSSVEQMELCGAVWNEHPGTYLQSHISENLDEIKWVKELYPNCEDYLDVYDRYGQIGPRAIYGHGIHLSERELSRMSESGTAIAHCPTSNLFLGSGLFSVENAFSKERPVRTGLATDLGGGTSFSQLTSMNEAYKIAQLRGQSLGAFHAFYLATRGAAEALYLQDKIGSIAPGMEGDVTVLDLKATPLLAHRMNYAESLHDVLFVLMTLALPEVVKATYVGGVCKMSRKETFDLRQYMS